MSNLFTTLKHLFPRALAWRMPWNGFLRKYIDGLSETPKDVKDFADNVYLDMFPQTTRELELWEQQFNLVASGTEQNRRDNLAVRWVAQGGQGKDYLESVIHAAGFTDVFLHEWWTPTGGGGFTTKNPNLYITGAADVYFNQTGRVRSQFGRTKSEFSGIFTIPLLYINQFGRVRSQFGRPKAQFNPDSPNAGGSLLVNKGPDIDYPVPQNLDDFREMLYVGAETFPNFANIPVAQRDQFERLLLRYLPYSNWIGLLINYV